MITKNIYKLKELHKFEWESQGKKLTIRNNAREDRYDLYFLRFLDWGGNIISELQLFRITARNLSELEFYGLKVILNEKPKLSREDKEFLTQDQYFARDENGILWLYHQKPTKTAGFWECANGGKNIGFSTGINHLFPFITWESGKAWNKSELMGLEVME